MFRKVLFYTNKLKPLLRFYRNILELDIINNEQTSFTVSIGTSELTFVESDLPAFYHYAINIPGNQFSQIKYWIKDKLTLNRERSEEHTSELQSRGHLVCRLLLEKKKVIDIDMTLRDNSDLAMLLMF